MKSIIGCAMLVVILGSVICAMSYAIGWKPTIIVWAISLLLTTWVVLAIYLIVE